jgi:hypothetical protein
MNLDKLKNILLENYRYFKNERGLTEIKFNEAETNIVKIVSENFIESQMILRGVLH